MGGNWDKLRESKSAILQKIGNHYSTLRNTIIGLDANNDISELRWMLEVPKEFSTTANQPKGMTKR